MLAVIKALIEFIACGLKLTPVFKFIVKNKLLSPVVLACCVAMIISGAYIITIIYDNNLPFHRTTKNNAISKYIKDAVKSCGDGTAISLATVSTKKQSDINYPYRGGFDFAMACDDRNKGDCIDNLKLTKPLYNQEYKIDQHSYSKLLGSRKITSYFYLRNLAGIQDFADLETYISIKGLVNGGQWASEGKLERLWIKTTTGFSFGGEEVIYVASFVSATKINNCKDSYEQILANLLDLTK
tara:strand:+ start:855 stop:1577 length:723 start_codon:yes stop_codon:yes gene_type:complete